MSRRFLVTVHGYAGDAHQVQNLLPYYEHHQMPIVILSPTDSPIAPMGPHICRHAGLREYIGAKSLERQRLQLEAMLDYPFDYFLSNDSDSVCITPRLPDYLFDSGDVLWSNEVSDAMHTRPDGYRWPQLAFQPPYFMSRRVVETLVKAAKYVKPDPKTPFIDWCMMAWAVQGNVRHKGFPDGVSCPTSDMHSARHMEGNVASRGAIFLHSIKTKPVIAQMANARRHWNRTRGRGLVL